MMLNLVIAALTNIAYIMCQEWWIYIPITLSIIPVIMEFRNLSLDLKLKMHLHEDAKKL